MTTTYKSVGIVLGNYWGGGKGSYEATKFYADTLEELMEKNNNALKDGSLDSGMGYESLIGALLTITTINTIEVDRKIFLNNEYNDIFIGNLTEKEMDFLQQL